MKERNEFNILKTILLATVATLLLAALFLTYNILVAHPFSPNALVRLCLIVLILAIAALGILFFKSWKLGTLSVVRRNELVRLNRELAGEIERRKNSEESLRRSVREWHQTFDCISSPIIVLDNELQIMKGNKAAYQLLGDEKSVVGQTCHEIFHGSAARCEQCYLLNQNTIPQPHTFEVEHQKLGKILRATCVPVFYDDELVGHVLTTVDLTRQRELERQLIQAQKMEAIATLAGGIAHDFNNILGAIMGNADLMLYRIPSESGQSRVSDKMPPLTFQEVGEHLQAIKKAGNRAKDLVRQILAFSRQSSSAFQCVDLRPVIKEVIKLFRSTLPSTIEIHANIQANLCQVNADPTQIHQVLMNLGTNAAQAMEKEGGELHISLSQTTVGEQDLASHPHLVAGPYLVLTVRDTGHGMSPETRERIFDPFFTTRQVGKGTGMGLSVIHGIITAHKGAVEVQSTSGVGTIFKVYLPCVENLESVVEETIVAVPQGAETVLFVDDEEEIVKMRSRMLSFLGYTVYTATSGQEALEIVQRQGKALDVVITDLTMPKMTGLQLAQKLVELRIDLPVILCSGYSETVLPEEARKAGIKKFLAKPLDMRALASAIREVMQARE